MYESRKFSECIVISQWCFNLYFPDYSCYWALLKILIDHLIFLYLNYSFFLLLFFLYHIFDTNSFLFVYIAVAKCVSQPVTCVTTSLLFVVGWGRKGSFGFVLTKQNYIFLYVYVCLCICIKNHFLPDAHKNTYICILAYISNLKMTRLCFSYLAVLSVCN